MNTNVSLFLFFCVLHHNVKSSFLDAVSMASVRVCIWASSSKEVENVEILMSLKIIAVYNRVIGLYGITFTINVYLTNVM